MTKNNNTGPLENLLDIISQKELDSRRREKYDGLIADAHRKNRLRKRRLRGIVVMSAAACLTVLIIMISTSDKTGYKELYESFYSPHDFPVEYRGPDSLNSFFLDAVKLYKEGQTDQAKKSLQSILDEDINNPDYILLMSQIRMQQKNFSASIVYLNQVIEFGGSYERTGFWYLALAYLATENYVQCAEALDSIIESGDPKKKREAVKLRRKIRKINNE